MATRHLAAGLLMAASVACSSKPGETPPATPPPTQQQAAGTLREGGQQVAQGLQQVARGVQQMAQAAATPRPYEQLVALLPELGGWTRNDTKGEQRTLPIPYARAEAQYRRDDSRIELEITDTALSQLLLAPLSMFLTPGFSERSDGGYARSLKIGGHTGYEKWSVSSRRGETTALVAGRFVVRATGEDVSNMDDVRRVVEAVDMTALARLK